MTFKHLFAPALLAVALAAPATAQVKAFGGSAPRMAATRIFFGEDFSKGDLGMVCIQYGQPQWKAEYDGMLDSLKGKHLRLGKDYWTTLNTSIPLQAGTTAIAAGSYYAGLKCDAEGAFSLVLMKAEESDKSGWAPWTGEKWKPAYVLPMPRTQAAKTADTMAIDLDVPDEANPARLDLKISWGSHVLTLPLMAQLKA